MKNKVVNKLLNICFDIVIIVLVLLAVIISISTFTARSNNGVPDLFGYSPFSVQSGSMEPTIMTGDYIIVDRVSADEANNLEKGDIISFHTIIEETVTINTHRIVDVIKDGEIIYYQTQGDNKETNPEPDEALVAPGDVIGIYEGTRIPALGKVMNFLTSKWGFFFVILVPVLLFTCFQVYKLIAAVMHNKKIEMVEDAAEGTSDEVKDKIIAEYLAQQKKDAENGSDNTSDGEDSAE